MARLYFSSAHNVLTAHLHAGAATRRTRVQLLHGSVRPASADPALRQRVRRTLYERRVMQACMGGQFLIEARAGRDAFAQALLAHIGATRARHGLDGLLLTVLAHLHDTGSEQLALGQQLWARTSSTADAGGEVAYDPRSGELVLLAASAFDARRTPLWSAFEHVLEERPRGVLMGKRRAHWSSAADALSAGLAGPVDTLCGWIDAPDDDPDNFPPRESCPPADEDGANCWHVIAVTGAVSGAGARVKPQGRWRA